MNENPWKVERLSVGYGIYRKTTNEEYANKAGDNLIFDTYSETKLFVDRLNMNEARFIAAS